MLRAGLFGSSVGGEMASLDFGVCGTILLFDGRYKFLPELKKPEFDEA